MAIVNNKENTIILSTSTLFKLSEQFGIDAYKCEVIWDLNTYDCETHDFAILYDRPTSIIVSFKNTDRKYCNHLNLHFTLMEIGSQ